MPEATAERVARLEQVVKMQSLVLLVLGLTVGCAATMGALQPNELEVNALRVVDAAGQTRFSLATDVDGASRFDTFDALGRRRAMLMAQAEGMGLFAISDRDEVPRLMLIADADGGAQFAAVDGFGTRRFAFGTDAESAVFVARDQENQLRFTLATHVSGAAGLVLVDSNREPVWSEQSR